MKRVVIWIALLLVAVLALLNAGRMLLDGLTDPRWAGFDLHSYWYYGHFVWEGINPYRAFALRLMPTLPITYWDGVQLDVPPPTADVLGNTPANSAPLLLALAPLARLSWPTARALWLLINLLLLLLYGHQLRAIFDPARRWHAPIVLIVGLLPLASAPALPAVVYGQTVVLASVALLGSMQLRARRPLAAGLLFGLALGKYSLGIALLPLLLVERRWRVLTTALALQLGALLAVAALDGSSVVDTARTYAVLAGLHVEAGGIHLAAAWGDRRMAIAAALLATAALLGWLAWRRPWRAPTAVLAAGSLWALLAVYHLHYDALLALPPLLYVVTRAGTPRALRYGGLAIGVALCWPVAALPALAGFGTTLLLLLLAALLWLAPPPAALCGCTGHQASLASGGPM